MSAPSSLHVPAGWPWAPCPRSSTTRPGSGALNSYGTPIASPTRCPYTAARTASLIGRDPGQGSAARPAFIVR